MVLSYFKEIKESISSSSLYQRVALGEKKWSQVVTFVLLLALLYAAINTTVASWIINPEISGIKHDDIVAALKGLELTIGPDNRTSHIRLQINKRTCKILIANIHSRLFYQLIAYPYTIPFKGSSDDPIVPSKIPNLAVFLPAPKKADEQLFKQVCLENNAILVIMEDVLVICSNNMENEDVADFHKKMPDYFYFDLLEPLLPTGGIRISKSEFTTYVDNILDSFFMRVLYKYKLITLIIDLFIFALHFVIALARSAFYIIIMTIFVYITAAIVRVCLRTPWFSFSTTMKLVAYTTTLHFIFSIPSIMELPSFPWIAPYIFLMYHHIYSLSERQVAVPAPVAPVAPPAR